MKNNANYYKLNLQYYFKTTKFKALLVIMIIISLYCSTALTKTTTGTLKYIPSIVVVFNNEVFIIFLLLTSLISNMVAFDLFNNHNYIIRFIDKKKYVNEMIKTTIIFSLVTYLIQIILVLIFLGISCDSGLGIYTMEIYNINIVFYALFILVKNMILIQCVSIINNLMMNIINRIVLIGISILYYVSILFRTTNVIDKSIRWRLIDYLSSQPYTSFITEVIHSFLYICILIIFIKMLMLLVSRYIKKVGE